MTMPTVKKLIRKELAFWVKKTAGKESPAAASTKRLAQEWESILKASGTDGSGSPGKGKRVLFVTGNGLNAIGLSIETLLAKSLMVRGHECISLICNRGLPSCEFNIGGCGALPMGKFVNGLTGLAKDQICGPCSASARLALETVGAKVHGLDEYGKVSAWIDLKQIADKVPLPEIRTYEYKGIKVGDHAFSSTLRITLRGIIDFDSPDEALIYRRQLLSSMVMVDRLNTALDVLKPDKVVAVHGIYLTHGVMAEVCAKRKIDVVIYGVPYRKGTVWFSHKETYHKSLVTDPVSNWKDLVLTPEMEKVLNEYLDSKVAGGRDNVNYHPNPITERESVINALGLDPKLPIISMFTNVIWDAQILYQFNAFKDIFDWLFSSIEYFKGRPDLQIVIRIHPAETKGGFTTQQPMAPEIAKRFPSLPKNVVVVPPESDISSYTLTEMSQASIIYGTKMGLEIAMRGIPCIVAGETFNRRKGYTYDAETREEYFAILDRVMDLPRNSDAMIQNVKKFSYYLFFQRMFDLSLLNRNLHGSHREAGVDFYTFKTIEDLAPGRNRFLDTICEGIINGSPLIAAA
jgi:hypothetical protein